MDVDLTRGPTRRSKDTTDVAEYAARLHGTLTATGGEDPWVFYVAWGAADAGESLTAWEHVVNLGTLPAGAFSTELSGLDPNVEHFYRVYATNSAGRDWGAGRFELHNGDGAAALDRGPSAPEAQLGFWYLFDGSRDTAKSETRVPTLVPAGLPPIGTICRDLPRKLGVCAFAARSTGPASVR